MPTTPDTRRIFIGTLIRTPCALAAALLLALGATACVSTPEVPRENVQIAEEDLVAEASRQVLVEEGHELAVDDGRVLETVWRGQGDSRERVVVRITESSMGVALATRVRYAEPIPADELEQARRGDTDDDLVNIEGQLWRVDPERRADARAEESRVGKLIQSRWRELRQRAVSDAIREQP